MLTPNDLNVVLQLVGRASIPVAEVPAIWPTIQRLEAAAKARVNFVAELPDIGPAESAGGTA